MQQNLNKDVYTDENGETCAPASTAQTVYMLAGLPATAAVGICAGKAVRDQLTTTHDTSTDPMVKALTNYADVTGVAAGLLTGGILLVAGAKCMLR